MKTLKIIEVEIEVVTGLRIGGEKETFEIGGLDNPVIRIVIDEKNGKLPYIPGSSLKGRIRSLLEQKYLLPIANNKKEIEKEIEKWGYRATKELKNIIKNDPNLSNEPNISKIIDIIDFFESSEGVKMIFSDLLPTKETIEKWEKMKEKEITEDLGTEIKIENTIDRKTGTTVSGGLRQMERVVRGSIFRGSITIICNSEKEEKRAIELLEEGFELLAKTYLGGSGSRGYGKVNIKFDGKEYKAEIGV